jgi:hypothetical protein
VRVTRSWIWIAGAVVFGVRPAIADEPVLHEYFESDPSEDLKWSTTTSDGRLRAVIPTENGLVSAPDHDDGTREVVYGSSGANAPTDSSYRIDRDTSRPELVRYDDPFTPSVAPFKRLFAYDALDAGLELVVNQRRLLPISVGGDARPGEDQFYADLQVDLSASQPTRIPSVGPGSRVLRVSIQPAVEFKLEHDAADNWFVTGSVSARVRLVMELAIPRAVFGSGPGGQDFAQVSWAELGPFVPPVPDSLRPAVERVAQHIGVSRASSPRDALARLVDYFRRFAPSDEGLEQSTPLRIYEELALSQKGVCRHRAYAFLVTALGLGLPARFVRNEAHAWVEVYDTKLWHRIDLGGAASELEYRSDPGAPAYRNPEDSYPWPAGSERGEDLAQSPADTSQGSNPTDSGANAAPSADPAAAAGPDADRAAHERDERPAAELSFTLEQREVARGATLNISGVARSDGHICSSARIDVAIEAQNQKYSIASLPSDDQGRFSGRLTVPLTVPVGQHRVIVSTPGAGACGRSR